MVLSDSMGVLFIFPCIFSKLALLSMRLNLGKPHVHEQQKQTEMGGMALIFQDTKASI